MGKSKIKIISKDNQLQIDSSLMTFINKMGKYYESFGISRIGGQIAGLLLVSERPLSADEIQVLLEVSRSSISTNLNILLLSAGVEEVHIQGDRKSYFAISNHAIEHTIQRKISSYDYLKEVVKEGIENLKKKNMSVDKLSNLFKWIELDKISSEELLERWKNSIHKK